MTKRQIPLETGTVFHVPFELCDEWLIINKDLILLIGDMSHDSSHTPVRNHDAFAHAYVALHLRRECAESSEDDDWEFT